MTIIMLKCVNFDFFFLFNGCRCRGIFNLIILPSNFYYLSNQYTQSHTCQTHFLKMSTHYLYLKISHTSLFLLDCLSIFFPPLFWWQFSTTKRIKFYLWFFSLCYLFNHVYNSGCCIYSNVLIFIVFFLPFFKKSVFMNRL